MIWSRNTTAATKTQYAPACQFPKNSMNIWSVKTKLHAFKVASAPAFLIDLPDEISFKVSFLKDNNCLPLCGLFVRYDCRSLFLFGLYIRMQQCRSFWKLFPGWTYPRTWSSGQKPEHFWPRVSFGGHLSDLSQSACRAGRSCLCISTNLGQGCPSRFCPSFWRKNQPNLQASQVASLFKWPIQWPLWPQNSSKILMEQSDKN